MLGHIKPVAKFQQFAKEQLQVFDLGGVLGHLPSPWGRPLRLVGAPGEIKNW